MPLSIWFFIYTLKRMEEEKKERKDESQGKLEGVGKKVSEEFNKKCLL